jgi:hypothetical protein
VKDKKESSFLNSLSRTGVKTQTYYREMKWGTEEYRGLMRLSSEWKIKRKGIQITFCNARGRVDTAVFYLGQTSNTKGYFRTGESIFIYSS